MIKVYKQDLKLNDKLVKKFSSKEELENFFREEGAKVWKSIQCTIENFDEEAINAPANKWIDCLEKAIERSRNYYTTVKILRTFLFQINRITQKQRNCVFLQKYRLIIL